MTVHFDPISFPVPLATANCRYSTGSNGSASLVRNCVCGLPKAREQVSLGVVYRIVKEVEHLILFYRVIVCVRSYLILNLNSLGFERGVGIV